MNLPTEHRGEHVLPWGSTVLGRTKLRSSVQGDPTLRRPLIILKPPHRVLRSAQDPELIRSNTVGSESEGSCAPPVGIADRGPQETL